MRKKIVAGNWKMNLLSAEAKNLFNELVDRSSEVEGPELIVFPPSLFISEIAKNDTAIKVGAQNFYPCESGAFTGEVSITQIKDCGATYALIGHSERRMLFHEGNEIIQRKVNAAVKHGVKFIFCCGEPLDIRENGQEIEFVKQQLQDSLFHLTSDVIKNSIIAYEPIWAIGTGKTATFEQAEEMHSAIRSWISNQYDTVTANSISILYGGSCNPSNAKELFACPNVDGGLIGGASLDATSFISIASSF